MSEDHNKNQAKSGNEFLSESQSYKSASNMINTFGLSRGETERERQRRERIE
jgi:hypothetical protein